MSFPIPYKFQNRGVRRIERFNGRALLADEMGLGKTPQSLWWIKHYLKDGPIVVVCPKSIKLNWAREATHFIGYPSIILSTNKPPKKLTLHTKNVLLILNYDILQSWTLLLKKLKPKLIILDECHAIKSVAAKRTKACRELCRKVKHIIGISGTPLTNRPIELWSVLNILLPDLFPSYTAFGNRYCQPTHTYWGTQYKGAERLDELHGILKDHVMIRRKKSQVLKDLPPKQRTVLPIKIDNMKEYKEAETNFIRWLMATRPEKANGARAAERLVKMGYLKRLAATLKLRQVSEWIDNFMEESDGKLIVFGIHHAILLPMYEEHKKHSVLVNGQVSTEDRQIAIDQFRTNKKIRLFFGNIQAAGVGWNGQVAQSVMFAELDWVPANHIQAEDRAHRIGQKNAVNVYYLIAEDTIEVYLANVIQSKQKVLDQTLDGALQDDAINVLDKLEEAMIANRGFKLSS